MPIRTVKSYSDRGNIKQLVQRHENEVPFTNFELRIKKLYDCAVKNKNLCLLSSLGFITTDYINDKTALPLSIYRLRQITNNIIEQSKDKIFIMKQDLDNCFMANNQYCLAVKKAENRQRESLIKVANVNYSSKVCKRSFWKASDK